MPFLGSIFFLIFLYPSSHLEQKNTARCQHSSSRAGMPCFLGLGIFSRLLKTECFQQKAVIFPQTIDVLERCKNNAESEVSRGRFGGGGEVRTVMCEDS